MATKLELKIQQKSILSKQNFFPEDQQIFDNCSPRVIFVSMSHGRGQGLGSKKQQPWKPLCSKKNTTCNRTWLLLECFEAGNDLPWGIPIKFRPGNTLIFFSKQDLKCVVLVVFWDEWPPPSLHVWYRNDWWRSWVMVFYFDSGV